MKKRHTIRKWMLAPMVLALECLFCFPAMAGVVGRLEWADSRQIVGWAWDTEAPEEILDVTVSIASAGSDEPIQTWTVQADAVRDDVAELNGYSGHGFSCPIDWTSMEGSIFTLTAFTEKGTDIFYLTGTISYDTAAAVPVFAISAEPAEENGVIFAPPAAEPDGSDGCRLDAPGEGLTADTLEVIVGPELMEMAFDGPGLYTDPLDPSVKYRKGASLGQHVTTGYCACAECSGGWGITYSGTIPMANHTVSADISLYPIGTKLIINDVLYTVEDTGSGVAGKHIDIFYDRHEDATGHGKQTAEVFAAEAVLQ